MMSSSGFDPKEITGIEMPSDCAVRYSFLMTKYECDAMKNCMPVCARSLMMSRSSTTMLGCNPASGSSMNTADFRDRKWLPKRVSNMAIFFVPSEVSDMSNSMFPCLNTHLCFSLENNNRPSMAFSSLYRTLLNVFTFLPFEVGFRALARS